MKPKPDPVISATYVIHNGRHHNYVRDWQGNIRNDRDYYPYGLPTSVSSIPESDSYGFSGKELERFRGLNLYDFEARTYVPDEARFWQPDPMADNYPGISPYAYCAGDPINFIDPTGKDIYEFDKKGVITSITKTDKYDLVRVHSINGSIQEAVFDYGTIQTPRKISHQGYYFKVKGIQNSNSIYFMLASNTDVEWSLVQVVNKETGACDNYVSTSNKKNIENTGSIILLDLLDAEDYILTRDIHSHPNNNIPSGFPDDFKPEEEIKGDIPTAKLINERYPYFNKFELFRVPSLKIDI